VAVAGDDRAQLLVADHVVAMCEAVRSVLLDDGHDPLGAVPAVDIHEGGRRPAQLLICGQCVDRIGCSGELVREDAGVDDRLS
jgi:hypothetical protein